MVYPYPKRRKTGILFGPPWDEGEIITPETEEDTTVISPLEERKRKLFQNQEEFNEQEWEENWQQWREYFRTKGNPEDTLDSVVEEYLGKILKRGYSSIQGLPDSSPYNAVDPNTRPIPEPLSGSAQIGTFPLRQFSGARLSEAQQQLSIRPDTSIVARYGQFPEEEPPEASIGALYGAQVGKDIGETVAQVQTQAYQNPQAFLADLMLRGDRPQQTNVLRGMGLNDDEISQIFTGYDTRTRINQLYPVIFKGYDQEEFADLLENNQELFIKLIQQGGWTKDKEELLTLLGLSNQDLWQIFPMRQTEGGSTVLQGAETSTWEQEEAEAAAMRYREPFLKKLGAILKSAPQRGLETAKSLGAIPPVPKRPLWEPGAAEEWLNQLLDNAEKFPAFANELFQAFITPASSKPNPPQWEIALEALGLTPASGITLGASKMLELAPGYIEAASRTSPFLTSTLASVPGKVPKKGRLWTQADINLITPKGEKPVFKVGDKMSPQEAEVIDKAKATGTGLGQAALPEAKPVKEPLTSFSRIHAKQPYEMTLAEWTDKTPIKGNAGYTHRIEIEKALSEGKPVPPEVLADYPDLAAKYAKPPLQKGVSEVTPIVEPAIPKEAVSYLEESFKEFGIKPGDTITFTPPYSKERFTGVLQNDGRVIAANGLEEHPNWERLRPADLTISKGKPPVTEPSPVITYEMLSNPEVARQYLKIEHTNKGYRDLIEAAKQEAQNPRLRTRPATKQLQDIDEDDVFAAKKAWIQANPVSPAPVKAVEGAKTEIPKPAPETVPPTKPPKIGKPPVSQAEADDKVNRFTQYLFSPESKADEELQNEMFKAERAKRADAYNKRLAQLLTEGTDPEQAYNQVLKETMSGALPRPKGFSEILADETREALFAKIRFYFEKHPDTYEEISTRNALLKALGDPEAGIPPKPITSELGGKGGSQRTRLEKVFGEQSSVMKMLEKAKKLEEQFEEARLGKAKIPEWKEFHVPPSTVHAQIQLGEEGGELAKGIEGIKEDITALQQGKFNQYLLSPEEQLTVKSKTPTEFIIPKTKPSPNDLTIPLDTLLDNPESIRGLFPSNDLNEWFENIQRLRRLDIYQDMKNWEFRIPADIAAEQANMFGSKVLKDMLAKRYSWAAFGQDVSDVLNIPRVLTTIADLSASLRQGVLLAAGQPVQFGHAFVEQIKALVSPKYAAFMEALNNSGEFARIGREAGLYIAPLSENAPLTGREEAFMSNLINKVPVLKQVKGASERAYVTFLNTLRRQTFDYYARQWAHTGKTMKDYEDLARFINHATGRGDLGRLENAGAWLNAGFFSPRFVASRVQVPFDIFRSTPAVRKVVARNLVAFVGEGMGILGLAKLSGAEVESDPRSADFGKIKIGNTRYDFWGSYLPYVRLVTQLRTGERLSTKTGGLVPLDKEETIINFLRSKESPIAGFVHDLIKGETFMGDELRMSDAGKIAIERLTPMVLGDILDAMKESGWTGGVAAGVPSILGVGVQTYSDNWNTNSARLGIKEEPVSFMGAPEVYDTKKFFSDTSREIGTATAENLKGKQGVPPKVVAVAEAKELKKQLSTMPNEQLKSINADKLKEGGTFETFYVQNQQRQKLVEQGENARYTRRELQKDGTYREETYKGEEAIKKFDQDNPKARLGNITQRQYALLQQRAAITDPRALKEFDEKHPELSQNPTTEWLKANPTENAKLAIHGQADILTRKAYSEARRLIEELDYPDEAVKEYMPDPQIADAYFDFMDVKEKFGVNSPQAKVALAKNDKLREYLGYKQDDTPVASWELKAKHYDTNQKIKDIQENGLLSDAEKLREIKKLKTPEFIDDERRIEAYGKERGDKFAEDFVKYRQMMDKEGVGPNSAEVMLNRVDNPEFNAWLTDVNIWGKEADKPIDRSKIPHWRFQKTYKTENDAYAKILAENEGREEREATQAYLRGDGLEGAALQRRLEWVDERRREQARGFVHADTGYKFPPEKIESWVNFNKQPAKGNWRERYLLSDPDLVRQLQLAGQKATMPDASKVPPQEYDEIYDNNKDAFDEWENLANLESKWAKKNPDGTINKDAVKARQKAMQFTVETRNYGTKTVQTKTVTDFWRLKKRREVLLDMVPPGQMTDDQVEWLALKEEGQPDNWKEISGQNAWYEEDWFAEEHPQWYRDVYLNPKYNNGVVRQRLDFRPVPTRAVFNRYLENYVPLLKAKNGEPDIKAMNAILNKDTELRNWMAIKDDWEKIDKAKPAIQKYLEEKTYEEATLQKTYGANSPRVKLWWADPKQADYRAWKMDKNIWGDNVREAPEMKDKPVWEYQVNFEGQIKNRQAVADKYNVQIKQLNEQWQAEKNTYTQNQISQQIKDIERQKDNAFEAFDQADTPFRKAKRRIEGYQKGIAQPYLDKYVDYYEKGEKGYRQERMLLEDSKFAAEMKKIGVDLPARAIPSEDWDKLYEANKADFDRFWGLNNISKKEYYIPDTDLRKNVRKDMLFTPDNKLTEFGKKVIELNAYSKLVPKHHVSTWVKYYTIINEGKPGGAEKYEEVNKTDRWYEDDWAMQENKAFHDEVWVGLLGNKAKNFDKVPTREVFNLYLRYLKIPKEQTTQRELFRLKNRNLDEWGVKAGIWSKHIYENKQIQEARKFDMNLGKGNIETIEIPETTKPSDLKTEIDEIIRRNRMRPRK